MGDLCGLVRDRAPHRSCSRTYLKRHVVGGGRIMVGVKPDEYAAAKSVIPKASPRGNALGA
jgi:hypothetical protein